MRNMPFTLHLTVDRMGLRKELYLVSSFTYYYRCNNEDDMDDFDDENSPRDLLDKHIN